MDVYARPSRFLKHAHDTGLITLKSGIAPNHCARIVRGSSCACSAPNGLVVNGRNILVELDQQSISGFPGYVLPDDCTHDEELTVVTWLVRHRFLRFHTYREPVDKDNKESKKKKLVRDLDSNLFRCKDLGCKKCSINTLISEPVFCLKGMVVSAQNKGPTVESVLFPHASTD